MVVIPIVVYIAAESNKPNNG